VAEELREYGARRDEAFARLVAALRADPRVAAVWLSGAHGRGEDDEWSDFDLHVATADESFESILANREEIFRLAGPPLLVQAGFPSDSMPGGRFWLVAYTGPFHVDWNIGPVSQAARPRASRLLFETTAIPFAPEPDFLPEEEARDRLQKALEFFWAMAPIAVKYAARGWTHRAALQIELLQRGHEVLWAGAHGGLHADDAYHQNRAPEPAYAASLPRVGAVIDPVGALGVIRQFCAEVTRLHPALAARGVNVSPELPAEVERLSSVAAPWAARGGSRPDSGSRR
jgi:predicted nucleotidyltransferase